ncbi:MAG: membrane protein insertion efficiency factor YidD [Candidatus Blackburnbacteria bacterium]|nr:membrane protein insertion efficiency factor YidD [Candidatus Blackburnbacteria bacterium]
MNRLTLYIIKKYRLFLRFLFLAALIPPKGNCRFYPTCSSYAQGAVNKYGFLKGGLLGAWRVLRCHPFSKGGNDPLL